MRLGLDLDGVVCDLYGGLFAVAGVPISRLKEIESYGFQPVLDWDTVWPKVKDVDAYWLSCSVMDGYIPDCCKVFITSRYCSIEITKRWLKTHGLDKIPLIQVSTPEEKVEILRIYNLTGLVDDRGETYEMVKGEFPDSFLVSRPWNRWVNTPNRIYKLEELDWRVAH